VGLSCQAAEAAGWECIIAADGRPLNAVPRFQHSAVPPNCPGVSRPIAADNRAAPHRPGSTPDCVRCILHAWAMILPARAIVVRPTPPRADCRLHGVGMPALPATLPRLDAPLSRTMLTKPVHAPSSRRACTQHLHSPPVHAAPYAKTHFVPLPSGCLELTSLVRPPLILDGYTQHRPR